MLFDEPHNLLVHVMSLCPYLIVQVRTVERTKEILCRNDAETLLYVLTYLLCSCSRKGYDRGSAYIVDDRAQASVFRTEVMAPF